MPANKEYKKSLEDEIDWKLIDQLHAATLNFSNASLELKKLFFVLVGIAIPSLIKLSKDRLDFSLFITLYVLSIAFWLLDGFTYYYQETLREKIDKHFNQIKARNNESIIITNNIIQDYTIEVKRTKKGRLFRSIFNPSVWFYLVLLILNTIALVLFFNHTI